MKRKVEVVVLSDLHLGTFGCQAKEIFDYLSSIETDILVLNGDIIDIWSFNKKYFPNAHIKVIHKILKMVTKNTRVFYILGNHDEALRKYADLRLGNLKLCNKLLLQIGGKKAWIFHGDVFDVTMKYSKWLAKLGGKGYDILILINKAVNWALEKMGRERYSFSKKVKNSIKKAISYINDFEETAISLAYDSGYDWVICGHIHNPNIKSVVREGKQMLYLNSGDWVENLSALEYSQGKWTLYKHDDKTQAKNNVLNDFLDEPEKNNHLIEEEFLYEDLIFNTRHGKWAHK